MLSVPALLDIYRDGFDFPLTSNHTKVMVYMGRFPQAHTNNELQLPAIYIERLATLNIVKMKTGIWRTNGKCFIIFSVSRRGHKIYDIYV